jgi:hypothetical protein
MIRENFLGTIKRSINQLAIISDVNTWFLIERLMHEKCIGSVGSAHCWIFVAR